LLYFNYFSGNRVLVNGFVSNLAQRFDCGRNQLRQMGDVGCRLRNRHPTSPICRNLS